MLLTSGEELIFTWHSLVTGIEQNTECRVQILALQRLLPRLLRLSLLRVLFTTKRLSFHLLTISFIFTHLSLLSLHRYFLLFLLFRFPLVLKLHLSRSHERFARYGISFILLALQVTNVHDLSLKGLSEYLIGTFLFIALLFKALVIGLHQVHWLHQ